MATYVPLFVLIAFGLIFLVPLVVGRMAKSRFRHAIVQDLRANGWTDSYRGVLVTFKETRNGHDVNTHVATGGMTKAIVLATTYSGNGSNESQNFRDDVTFIGNPHTNTDLEATLQKARTTGEQSDGNELPVGDTRVMDAAAWSRVICSGRWAGDSSSSTSGTRPSAITGVVASPNISCIRTASAGGFSAW